MKRRGILKIIAGVGLVMFFLGIFSEPISALLVSLGSFIFIIFLVISEAEFEDRLEDNLK